MYRTSERHYIGLLEKPTKLQQTSKMIKILKLFIKYQNQVVKK